MEDVDSVDHTWLDSEGNESGQKKYTYVIWSNFGNAACVAKS